MKYHVTMNASLKLNLQHAVFSLGFRKNYGKSQSYDKILEPLRSMKMSLVRLILTKTPFSRFHAGFCVEFAPMWYWFSLKNIP